MEQLEHPDITRALLRTAIRHYGENNQLNQLMEEMAELTVAISKCARKLGGVDAVAEEIADVGIMLEQAIMIFDCAKLVEDQRKYKLKRLEERLR